MNKLIFLISMGLLTQFCFSQNSIRDKRCVRVRPYVDTTNIQFKEIYNFWENYQDFLCATIPSNKEVLFEKYWAKTEIEKYKKPDIMLNLNPFYFFMPEYLIGIEMRNDTLFEIKTSYKSEFMKPESDIIIMFSVYVIKKDGEYFLYNKFSENSKDYNLYQKDWLKCLYSDKYDFKREKVDSLYTRASNFLNDFGFKKPDTINYFLSSTCTDLHDLLGYDVAYQDFQSASTIKSYGISYAANRTLLYTKGGESKLHEFIHLFIRDFRGKNLDTEFDEGLCVYFGEHVGLSFDYHKKRLKTFLNNNQQIDLSENLFYGVMRADGKFYNDSLTDENRNNYRGYADEKTSFAYIIMGTVCEMALKKGGYDLIKQMVLESENIEELYLAIEKYLGIKREDLNKYLRKYIKLNY